MNGDVTFNSHDLQTFDYVTRVGIVTSKISHTDVPEQDMELLALADNDGNVIPGITFPSKKVTISGSIVGSTQANLDTRIDTFKGYFIGKDKDLDIAYGSGTRRYIATKNAISVERNDKALFANFIVEFICKPFGRDTSPTSIMSSLNETDATETAVVTVGGTAPTQLPIITLTFDAITIGSADYIQISNDINGQEMVLYELGLEAGDVVVVDCENREVTVNDEAVDYVGTFLELEPGSGSITVTDGFTSRTVDREIEYYKRWQ